MKQKFLIFIALISLMALLIGLNAASFVRKEKTPDSESNPNRSTYNTGATGTRALYDLLAETGKKPLRWQETVSSLSVSDKNNPSTFVIIGKLRREFTDKETEQLLHWVSAGGKLVIIDREPPAELIKTTANWSIVVNQAQTFDINPYDQSQMTEKTAAAKPVQPTVFTAQINAVQPSRSASGILFERFSDENVSPSEIKSVGKSTAPTLKISPVEEKPIETIALTAPVVHLANDEKNLLIDFPFGSGQIVFLSDPYIVSNGGINLVDNTQLALNILTSPDNGIIAFDEYHQGYGANNNRLFEYFSGTPFVPIFLQLAALVGLILFSQSRRFARPLLVTEPNRLSKLEYVSAMAELQRRTRAFDLAIENIYTDFRRRTARAFGVDNFTISLRDLAEMIAERAETGADETENLMFKCEEIIRGEPTNKKEVLEITSRLRETEEKLGLKRARKQTFKK